VNAPFWKADPRRWELQCEAYSLAWPTWPVEIQVEDLRWHGDQVTVKRLARIPSVRVLAKRWGTTKHQAGKVLAAYLDEHPEHDHRKPFRTPVGQSSDTGRTPVGQSSDTVEQANANNEPEPGQSSDTGRTPVGQSSDRNRHTRVSTEQQSTEHRAQTDTAAGKPPERAPDDWTTLAELYGTLPSCRKPSSRKRGNGSHLRKLLDHHGLDLAQLVLRWWAYDSTPDGRAVYLRNGSHKLPTLATNDRIDAYAEMALEWKARGSPGDPEAKRRTPPVLDWKAQRARDLANRPRTGATT
jgi:hypothetical protein